MRKFWIVLSLILLGAVFTGCGDEAENVPPVELSDDEKSAKEDSAVDTEMETVESEPEEIDPFEDFKAVLRFTVSSDLQYGEGTAKSGVTMEDFQQRLIDFIEYSYTLCAADESYKGCDLIAHVGDLTASGTVDQYDICRAIMDEHVREGTELFVTMGNHEFYNGLTENDSIERFNGYFGEENRMVDINGYSFVGISPHTESFSSQTLIWLNKELLALSQADETGNRPIFVFTHQNPSDTVLGSQSGAWGWDDPTLGKILEKYPQVIDFTGHSHFASEDPASFWQGDYSVFNTGTLAHLCKFNTDTEQITVTDNDKWFNLDGKYHYACAFVVEADADGNVVVRCFDVLSGNYIGETYYLAAGRKDYHYKTRFADTVIYFEEDAAVTIDNTGTNSVEFTYDACSPDGFLANNYMFEFYDASGMLEKTEYISYEYFDPNPNRDITARVTGLTAGTEYTLKIYGINPLYKSTVTYEGRIISEPLTVSFTTNTAQ